MNIFTAFLNTLIIISAFFLTSYNVKAALEQPPGQFPITEPLQSVPDGITPNYSGNIQDGEPANLDDENVQDSVPSTENNESIGADESGSTDVDESIENQELSDPVQKSSKLWALVTALIILLGIVGLWFWRKKSMVGPVVIVFLIAPTLMIGGITAQLTHAQSLPSNSQPVQRIIVEEGAETLSGDTAAQGKRNGTTAIYGLLATGLVLIAAGAAYLLWIRSLEPKQNSD